jgi:A/G-specific adenine glycosylase
MLQQTQVATVIPYYERWLRAFPSLASLAAAPLPKALKLWAGLGYYRRARMFHQAARHVQYKLHGKIPRTAEALRELPGIGRYTAGAIASISWGERTPVLDGNVIRILTRIFGVSQSIDQPSTQERLWKLATALLPAKNSGDFNQAMMELGATVCFPLNPDCFQCPVRKNCQAHQKGNELSYPVRSRKEKYEKLIMAALVLVDPRGKIWLEKQPEHGRWGGLWMFPFWKSEKTMFGELGSLGWKPAFKMKVQHGFTKYRITLNVFGLATGKAVWKRRSGRWFSIGNLARVASPSPHRKIAQALMKQSGVFAPLFPA